MVRFLLANSLGAWWTSRLPNTPHPCGNTHQRVAITDASRFKNWPDDLASLKVLDPCCGSGHFLVAAFLNLVPMRMALEDLTAAAAVDAVLGDNLHGLELDRRCVAIAAFALALEAWRYPGAGGFRPLPRLRVAWCGQSVASEEEFWVALAEGDPRREAGMAALHRAFAKAPVLGSLIDPSESVVDLLTADFADLRQPLKDALHANAGNERIEEMAVAAQGLAEAAELLTQRYHLILTNVPYLGREKHTASLRDFCETHYALAKHDLATVFLERLFGLCDKGGELMLVLPRNWLFLARYKALRKRLLAKRCWRFLATLGPGAFETITGEVVNTCLLAIGSAPTGPERQFRMAGRLRQSDIHAEGSCIGRGAGDHAHSSEPARQPGLRSWICERGATPCWNARRTPIKVWPPATTPSSYSAFGKYGPAKAAGSSFSSPLQPLAA